MTFYLHFHSPYKRVYTHANNYYSAIYAAIIERSEAEVDVKANLEGDLIKMLDRSLFLFHQINDKIPKKKEYKTVKKLLGLKFIRNSCISCAIEKILRQRKSISDQKYRIAKRNMSDA